MHNMCWKSTKGRAAVCIILAGYHSRALSVKRKQNKQVVVVVVVRWWLGGGGGG